MRNNGGMPNNETSGNDAIVRELAFTARKMCFRHFSFFLFSLFSFLVSPDRAYASFIAWRAWTNWVVNSVSPGEEGGWGRLTLVPRPPRMRCLSRGPCCRSTPTHPHPQQRIKIDRHARYDSMFKADRGAVG